MSTKLGAHHEASAKDVLSANTIDEFSRMRRTDRNFIFTDILDIKPGVDEACFILSNRHTGNVKWSKASNLYTRPEEIEFTVSDVCPRYIYASINPKSRHVNLGTESNVEIPDLLHMIEQSKYDARKVHANAAANLGEKGAAAIATNWARNAYGGETSAQYMPQFSAGQYYDSEGIPIPTVMHSLDLKLQEVYDRTQDLLNQYEADRTALVTTLELGVGETLSLIHI